MAAGVQLGAPGAWALDLSHGLLAAHYDAMFDGYQIHDTLDLAIDGLTADQAREWARTGYVFAEVRIEIARGDFSGAVRRRLRGPWRVVAFEPTRTIAGGWNKLTLRRYTDEDNVTAFTAEQLVPP